MLPIVLKPSATKVGLAGLGAGRDRREALLTESGISPILVSAKDLRDVESLDLLYVAGLDRDASGRLASHAKALGVLVNVEDRPDLCDFHVPAIVRRGDLLVTVSSGGRAPGLVKLLREWLSAKFSPEWAGHVESVGRKRTLWRSDAVPPAEISDKTRAIAAEWLR